MVKLGRDGFAKAAEIIFVATLVSKFLGFGREMAFAAFFGASREMDAYLIASSIPAELLNAIMYTGIVSAVIPVYNSYLAINDQKNAKELIGNVLGIVIFFTCIIAGVYYCFAPRLISIVAPGFSHETRDLAISLTHFMIPILVLSPLIGLASAIQQAHGRFIYPAIGLLPVNIVIICGVVFCGAQYGIHAAAWGCTLGFLARLLSQWPGLKKCGYRIKFNMGFSSPGIKKIMVLFLPLIISSAACQINALVSKAMASTLSTGSISALTYANKINTVFITFLTTPLLTVLFPSMSRYFALKDLKAYKYHLNLSIRLISFITLPVMAMLILYNSEIVGVLLQRGAFDSHAVAATSFALLYFSFGMLGMAFLDLFNQAFYAQQNTYLPVIVNCGVVAANICMNFIFISALNIGGLALSNSLSTAGGVLTLFYILQRRIGDIGNSVLMRALKKSLAATLFMGAVSYAVYCILIYVPIFGIIPANWVNLLQLAIIIAVGFIIYIITSVILRSEELFFLLEIIADKVPLFSKIVKRFHLSRLGSYLDKITEG